MVVVKRRLDRGKENVKLGDLSASWLKGKLAEVHTLMFEKAQNFRDENIRDAASYEELKKILAEKGGFVRCFFKQDKSVEARIKEETKATVRCIPLDSHAKRGKCIMSGAADGEQVLFAVAY
jgi:prolyl-tRNA synthetase